MKRAVLLIGIPYTIHAGKFCAMIGVMIWLCLIKVLVLSLISTTVH